MDRTQRTTTETDGRAGARRVRKGLAGLALAAAVTGPVTMAADAPAGAAGCSDWYCGSTGNHNETAGRDRRRVRKALAGLALAAAVTGPVTMAADAPAGAAGCSEWYCGTSGNHNETAGRDPRNRRRAMGTVIAAASVALVAVLVGAEPVVARIAVNHNESVGVDGR